MKNCLTKKNGEKHPAAIFYWDVIHNIWQNILLEPKRVVHLWNYFVKLSTALQSYQRFTYCQDTYNYCLCDPHELFDLTNFLNVLRLYDFLVKVNYSFAQHFYYIYVTLLYVSSKSMCCVVFWLKVNRGHLTPNYLSLSLSPNSVKSKQYYNRVRCVRTFFFSILFCY